MEKLKIVLRHNNWLGTMEHGWGNGYVALPKEHPFNGVHYDSIPVDIHGGHISSLVMLIQQKTQKRMTMMVHSIFRRQSTLPEKPLMTTYMAETPTPLYMTACWWNCQTSSIGTSNQAIQRRKK